MKGKICYVYVLFLGLIFDNGSLVKADQFESSLSLKEKFSNLVKSVNHFQFLIGHFKHDRAYISKTNLFMIYEDCIQLEKQNKEMISDLEMNEISKGSVSTKYSFCQKIKANFLDSLEDSFTLKTEYPKYQQLLNTLEDVIKPFIGNSMVSDVNNGNYLQYYAEAIIQKENEAFDLDLLKRQKKFSYTVVDENPMVTTSGSFVNINSIAGNGENTQFIEVPIQYSNGIIKKCISKSMSKNGERVSTILYTNKNDCNNAN